MSGGGAGAEGRWDSGGAGPEATQGRAQTGPAASSRAVPNTRGHKGVA